MEQAPGAAFSPAECRVAVWVTYAAVGRVTSARGRMLARGPNIPLQFARVPGLTIEDWTQPA
ncbi:MAG: hypothetical protein MUF18_06025 [Fimbriiglobus sp.]|nr:hypothetical protein [Fimbriiglobus sp.]